MSTIISFGLLISTELIIQRERERQRGGKSARARCKTTPAPICLCIARIYFRAHVRSPVRTHVRPATDVYIYIYTDVLGTEIWRTPSDSTRLAIIQFIGLSKAPVHAVFPDRSLSLSPLLCLPRAFPALSFRLACPPPPLSLSLSLSLAPLARARADPCSLFLPFTDIYPRINFFHLSSSRNASLSLLSDLPSPFGTLPPFARGRRSLRGGERLGAIRCDNCP